MGGKVFSWVCKCVCVPVLDKPVRYSIQSAIADEQYRVVHSIAAERVRVDPWFVEVEGSRTSVHVHRQWTDVHQSL